MKTHKIAGLNALDILTGGAMEFRGFAATVKDKFLFGLAGLANPDVELQPAPEREVQTIRIRERVSTNAASSLRYFTRFFPTYSMNPYRTLY